MSYHARAMGFELIVCDVDGCISPEESVAWDLDAVSRLAMMVREAPFTLCTGRPQPYVEALMKLLDVRLPTVCENGALYYSLHDNRSVFAPGVTDAGVQAIAAIDRFASTELPTRVPGAVLQEGKRAQVSIFTADPGAMPEIDAAVREFAATLNGAVELDIGASHYYFNVSLRGVDKGSGLIGLLDGPLAPSPPRERILAIGDTGGDIPMRDHVGFFAAPANATSAVKDLADYVSPYPDIRGLIDILERHYD